MSARLLGAAFYVPLPPHLKLTLQALADEADDDGGNCFPAQDRLAVKTSTSERNVRRNLRALEERGYVATTIRGGGGRDVRADRRPNGYQLAAERIAKEAAAAKAELARRRLEADGRTPASGRGGENGRTPEVEREDAGVQNGRTPASGDPKALPRSYPKTLGARAAGAPPVLLPEDESWAGRGDVEAALARIEATFPELPVDGPQPEKNPAWGLRDVAFWRAIEAATEGTEVYYLEELERYARWWSLQPSARRRKNLRRSFAAWVRKAIADYEWTREREARKRAR